MDEESVVTADVFGRCFSRVSKTLEKEPVDSDELEKFLQDVFDNESLIAEGGDRRLISTFTATCACVRPYLQYLPFLCPWVNVGSALQGYLRKNQIGSDFCWSSALDVDFICQALHEGFIPLGECIVGHTHPASYYDKERLPSSGSSAKGTDGHRVSTCSQSSTRQEQRIIIFLPKLNRIRCVMNPREMHIGKKAKRRSSRFQISINKLFDQVVDGCRAQHGENWLFPPISRALKEIMENGNPAIYSVEVLFDGRLVAGEIGGVNGTCYTSYTGFSSMDSAGSVQLATLGSLLISRGFEMWDLGMEMRYKTELGGKSIPRSDFLTRFHKLRDKTPPSLLLESAMICRAIIDSVQLD